VWIGTKATVLRGTTIGNGSVLGAHSLVRGEVPPFSVMGGVPARVLKDRREIYAQQEVRRIALQDIARKTKRAVEELSPQSKN
jgi:serine acetyltransferase